ncbi:MAG: S-layer homology domain-containing protein, partial [Oscillospiraceae bacterium]|nr:S-layer homology domain-containing protein [Oscillospiraceae bacterium]
MKRFISLLTALLMSVLILPFAAFAMDGSLAHFTTDREALTFVDVSSGDWFAPYVQGVSKAGLMIGVGEDRFAPEADITLAEVYTVTAR